MILALDKHEALYVFTSTGDAENYLEAIDVQQDAIEFCDACGQRYSPAYTVPPKVSRLGSIGLLDIGAFKLRAEGSIDTEMPGRFVERARHIEYTSLSSMTSIEALRDELQKQA